MNFYINIENGTLYKEEIKIYSSFHDLNFGDADPSTTRAASHKQNEAIAENISVKPVSLKIKHRNQFFSQTYSMLLNIKLL